MNKINWPKLWDNFGKWCDDEKQSHRGLPDWWQDQQPKIQQMVEAQLAKKPKKRG